MAIWLPDLAGREGPKYLQIVDAMAADIEDGVLPAGTRLPPHRELAYQLGLSPNTTSRAYAEAINRALLRGEVGRGTFVRSLQNARSDADPESLLRAASGPIDLSRNLPMPGFAEDHVRRAMAQIAQAPGMQSLLDYQTDTDLLRHRQAGQAWVSRCGLEVQADQIIPVVGGQHGILSVLMGLLRPGDLLLIEALTYTPVLTMAAHLNLKTGPVAMDAEGLVPDAFSEWCQKARPKALYLTPTLQAPTTTTLSASRRAQIAEIAQRHGVILIEDDVFGPLQQDKPAPLAQFAPEATIYVTSLSKTVAPGLRVGFLAAPRNLVPALHQSINLSVWMTPPMALEVGRYLIEDGSVDLLCRRQREAAAARQQLAQRILGPEMVPVSPQGFHLWLPLPEGWRADAFSAECSRLGVKVSEARSFALRPEDAPEAIRICVSHEQNEDRLRCGIEIIAGVLRQRPSGSAMTI